MQLLYACPKGNAPPDSESANGRAYYGLLQATISSLSWKGGFSHVWRGPEHINGLEISILASSLQWAASKALKKQNVLWLTDSSATFGALVKSRSSIKRMLVRCRKVASLATALDIHPRIAFVPSRINPADAPSRDH